MEDKRQYLALVEVTVMPGDDALQLGPGPCRGLVAQERVQYSHEVRLARAEGAGEERTSADPGADGFGDEPENTATQRPSIEVDEIAESRRALNLSAGSYSPSTPGLGAATLFPSASVPMAREVPCWTIAYVSCT